MSNTVDQPLIIGGRRVGTRHVDGSITFAPGLRAEALTSGQQQFSKAQGGKDQTDRITGEAEDAR
jgi:hypothetical protein